MPKEVTLRRREDEADRNILGFGIIIYLVDRGL